MTQARNDAYKRLGKLASLGLERMAHVPLYLPVGHDDLSAIAMSAHEHVDTDVAFPIYLRLRTTPRGFYNGAPRLVFDATDDAGDAYRVTIFGNTKEWAEVLAATTRACFLATAKVWNDATCLTATEIVGDEWVGRLRPRYAGKPRVMSPESVRDAILHLFPQALSEAVQHVAHQLAVFGPLPDLLTEVGAAGWTLEQVIAQNHLPASAVHGSHARVVFMRLAALGTMMRLHGRTEPFQPNPIPLPTLDARLASMRFSLTNDQRAAIAHIAAEIGRGDRSAHVLVLGEVGTGKTCCVSAITAAVADAPGRYRIAILAPNVILANQMLTELHTDFPELDAILVVGDTPTTADLDHQILVGTSAILFRSAGRTFDLVIVDEQHRFGRGAREQLVGSGTHLVELSATPIPRTQALIRFGRVSVVQLRETHKPKSIVTTLYEGRAGARDLFDAIGPAIRGGDPVLVVYPKRDIAASAEEEVLDLAGQALPKKDSVPVAGGINDRHSVESARERWEQLYPGKVRTLTGDDDDQTKATVLADIVARRAQIILCTTVVEVGVNLSNLYRIIIVCPERHGIMGLHQLRGRVARNGGDGYCELLCPEPLKHKQRERLLMFARTSSGFDLAEFDLHDRGAGDLAPDSDRQTGADQSFLFGTNLDLRYLDDIVPIWQRSQGLAVA